jgi:hypothetical protein
MFYVSLYNSGRTDDRTLLWTVRLLYSVYPLSRGRLPNRCLAMDYSGFQAFRHIHCHGNVLTEPLSSNGLFRLSGFVTHSLSRERLKDRCLAMDFSGLQASCHNIYTVFLLTSPYAHLGRQI